MLTNSSTTTTLGLAFHRYKDPAPFGIKLTDRLLHTYIVGQTGTGKSTLLGNLAMQDAAQGHGFCLIDPHGDLAERLHDSIQTPHLYWDVADPISPYGYNPIAVVSAAYRP
ncbi:MAG: type IV secretion system DNA-binding domain-containing protein, partial [Alphaproteobacteria bacterium]|nr:type IV secretion system DNA-binding domain-containing protein [Alphaproteobacteria bacterium]